MHRSRREIALLKDGVYFVNTARAAAVDEEPLYQALASGQIRAAALDVFWNEPVQPDNRFVKLDERDRDAAHRRCHRRRRSRTRAR